ncbi:phosphotidylinositol kinase [Grosmannia clavigera kw1407]|uniref:Serine/threonine-protein kinase TEL1 n=1 Tax=Grosmannia clavigera (strain kw1407 / UAMH 11150) TaxID=655863 RepID=F0XS95_GROCL|nr:phosphotidylinositol kinase [Grosmannia clavigera kw1407]EFW99426.1 phosphotidylinositol kinase [Grosmannia clavigera kw1407]
MPPTRARTAVAGDASAESIRASIASGNSTERSKALQDQTQLTRSRLSLDAKAYHNLIEALFQCSVTEKKTYLSGKRTTKTTAEARLAASAEALRLAVNYGASRLKRKVARAIVDHITETLPGRDLEYVEPLLQDYTKALVALLSHPSNVEQLGAFDGEGWLVCADFFAEAVDRFAEVPDRDTLAFGTFSRASPAPGTLPNSNFSGRSGSIPKQRTSSQTSSKILETLMQGLLYLVSAPNAPLKLRASQLSQAAIRVLQLQYLGIGHLQQAAFATIRCIVQSVRGDDICLVEGIAREVVPLIGHWWHPRSSASQSESVNSMREEILRTLFALQLHISALALHSPHCGILENIKDVLDSLWMEYSKRDDRTRLQASDISFSFIPTSYFSARIFGLSTHDAMSERRWAAIEVMAHLESIYMSNAKKLDSPDEADRDEHPRKRRRVGERPDRIRDNLSSSDLGLKLTALQIIPFFLQAASPIPVDATSDLLSHLSQSISDKQVLISAKDSSLSETWMQIWQIAARSVSLPGTSRAACALLHTILEAELIPHHVIGDDINSLVTVAEVSGPAVLCDSSLILMLHLLHLRNTILPSASEVTSNQIIRWAFSRWKPGDSNFASSYSAHAPSFDLVNLFMACLGAQSLGFPCPVEPYGGSISQSWKDQAEADEMMRYLLLLPDIESLQDSASSNSAKKTVLELLQPVTDEIMSMTDTWTRRGSDNAAQISIPRMQSLAAFCIICSILTPQLDPVNSSLARDLEPTLLKLIDVILKTLHEVGQSKALFEVWLFEVAFYLPSITVSESERFGKEHPVLLKLFAKLSQALRVESTKQSSVPDGDLMELDDEFDTAVSQGDVTSKTTIIPRQTLCLDIIPASFYLNVTQRLELLWHCHKDGNDTGVLPEAFVDQFLELSNEDLLLCHSFAKELFRSDLVVTPEDSLRVVEVVGDVIGLGEYSCCEAALSMCIDMMQSFICTWPDEKLEVSARIGDLYSYLVQQSLPKNSLSANAQINLSGLLYRLLEINSSYGGDLGLASCRSTLLSILQNGSMAVKYFVGMNIPKVFGLYVLKVHDDLFVDILEILPSDAGWPEGIAFRLLALAKLACTWPTLLRRCIYHIFETPGRLRQCAKFASRCLAQVSNALALASSRDLFQLFAPQLLYTWLEHDPIDEIPYEIFSFSSLDGLIDQAQTEATALMLMRGQDMAASHIAQRLGLELPSLVEQNFAEVMAYSVAHDIAMATDREKSKAAGESRLRKLLGKDRFLDAVYYNMADIVGILFNLIDQEDPIEKYFSKDDSLQYAADIMAEIKGFGHSPVVLPPNQQPMFRGKFLARELAHLCSRTEYDLSTLWTPALVVSVARRLMNTIRPALGSLHACSVIRKVRVLICLAGEQATSSYPLEMLLHAIRPYLQDAECADDTLGMTRYLLVRGTGHLTQFPSFYAGYSLSMLASLRMFLESSQASTTQENQFKATMGKAQHFHTWFTKQLLEYDSHAFKDDAQRTAFRSITQSATKIRASGNAEKGTPESTLLLEMLKDGARQNRLLNESARDLVLGMLCGDFQVPPWGRSDIIETDQDALEHEAEVWKSCGAQALSEGYLVWAGRVVGRSFAASGTVPEELVRELHISQDRQAASASGSSEQGLLHLLETLTVNRESVTAGLAESGLRTIVSQATNEGDSSLLLACQASLPEPLFVSSAWGLYRTPPSDFDRVAQKRQVKQTKGERSTGAGVDVFAASQIEEADWTQNLAVHLTNSIPEDVVLGVLGPIVRLEKGFAEKCLPFIVHLVLLFQVDKQQTLKRQLSEAATQWLGCRSRSGRENVKLLLSTMVYLRTQPLPGETSIADRQQWLAIDQTVAAAAASRCGMFKIALLFAEIGLSETSETSRTRSSGTSTSMTTTERRDLLLGIYENIDDPDAYYGVPQSPSLASVLARLEYEKDGAKALAFRGAQYDSHLRRGDMGALADSRALVQALSNNGQSGLSQALQQAQQDAGGGTTQTSQDSTFTTARRLGVWNLPVAATSSNGSVTMYRAFQQLHQTTSAVTAQQAVWAGLGRTMRQVVSRSATVAALRRQLGALAALTELDDVLRVRGADELSAVLAKFEEHSGWMKSRQYDDVSQLLSYRETTLSTIGQADYLRRQMQVSGAEARVAEVKGLLLSSRMYRFHHAMQESLNVTTALTDLIEPSAAMGLQVEAAVKMETASSLWEQGELMASIGILQSVEVQQQTVEVSRAELLSQIGQAVSAARLEGADAIQKRYLEPALAELQGGRTGAEAGRVFHQFATFCDEQLQSADGREDLARLQKLRQGKRSEVEQLEALVAGARDTATRQRYNSHLGKARQWLALDEQELQRVERTREEFVRLSVENYLLGLQASDEHNNDALRFTALWLERAGETGTNEAVRRQLEAVPSRKFAPLMNQLTSRLQEGGGAFQKLLIGLVFRICREHPYHGMYQIWSGVRTRPNAKDAVAVRRQKATERVARELAHTTAVAAIWQAIDKTSKCYHTLAVERDGRYKAGQRVALRDSAAGSALLQSLARYAIPPPTLTIPLREDRDYGPGHVPTIVRLEPTMSVALGVSAPKILTAVATDGQRYRQLVKGGNDDLRQDAIMEQVFAAVSGLLQRHRASRQRRLGIRTYKVLPLTAASGLIEFVPHTVPLHEYLMPAHERLHPRDLRGAQCRKEISAVQTQPTNARVAAYRRVASRFRPVMRYFFLETFPDPDDWFARRLAYTRATAAVSMLGHVLGLGDRHGHNILLDARTGEVVHIDLGVAFEMGRVLPVPELVPFRLTRDIVDGMGISGPEGVFRRCCEFTLDAMRAETYSIMTVLDVLRYDPLYSWSISPAERALEVVRKKLSKTLSVAATVNDLINQATDERNLAVLYSACKADALPSFPSHSTSRSSVLSVRHLDLSGDCIPTGKSGSRHTPRRTTTHSHRRSVSALSTILSYLVSVILIHLFSSFPPSMHPSSGPADGRLPASSNSLAPNSSSSSSSSSARRRQRVDSSSQPQPAALAPPEAKRQRSSGRDIFPTMNAKTQGKRPDVIDLTETPSSPASGPLAGSSTAATMVHTSTNTHAKMMPPTAVSGFQPHAGAKKLVIKNLRVASTSRAQEMEQYYQRTWTEIEEAVKAIFAGRPPRQPLERLYRGVEDLCLHDQAQRLYMTLKARCEEHLSKTVLPQLRADTRGASNVDVLRAVYRQWQVWCDKSTLIRSTFSYLDRAYVLNERSLQPINDMLLYRFRRMAFDGKATEPQVMPPGRQVLAGMCDLVTEDRLGHARFDGSLLREAVTMMHVLNVYGRYFEPAFLGAAETYLREFAAERDTAAAGDLTPYILAVDALLRREDLRCNEYSFDSSTKKALLDMAQRLLIVERVPMLVNEASVARLLDGGAGGGTGDATSVSSAKALYELLRLPRLQKQLRRPWESYIEAAGTAIVTDTARGDDMVVRLLELRRGLDVLVRDAFGRDEDMAHGLRTAFGRFVNGRPVADAWPSGASKVGELVAKHVDLLLRGGLKALPPALLSTGRDRAAAEQRGQSSTGDEDAELDRQLDLALELFRFIQGKDVFEAFYKKDLARRLLMGRSASQDAERSMLGKLKTECGSSLTHNLEQMFRDQELSRDEMAAYQQWLDNQRNDKDKRRDDEDRQAGRREIRTSGGVDLHVSVLSSAAWPTYGAVPLRLPADVLEQVQLFDGYYKAKHTGRQLTWMHALGHCVVRARFDRGPKELLVSAFQAVVLLLFNGGDEGDDPDTTPPPEALSYDQIAAGSGLEGGNLDRTLQSLACGKVRVLTKHPRGRDVRRTDTFSVNRGFTDGKYRIKINQIQLRETRAENAATYERVSADRQFETQAAIVRIMKSRKSLPHAQLVAEVIGQTKSRGALDPAEIKQNIEKLIEKDYLDREGGNYVYLA